MPSWFGLAHDDKKAVHWNFYCQWPSLLMPWRYNWVDFDLAKIGFEVGRSPFRNIEITFHLLGFGVFVMFMREPDETGKAIVAAKNEYRKVEAEPTP